ncbi:hypothetical protein BDZ90DRAFT_233788 [Jaminaea rosea]|uniref:cystathionine gamma-lyase n=1 Tax=Jaminaea rosea TaxID=1569628 RepID=A0A316UKM1_9BASI|nr:hypothetical protein BDZ90DRAFT_233788 [Jaminaea rosea]PWN25780.1 hypothetical protein BDZ90DRAFT_233788 [Jaminaea rosea]
MAPSINGTAGATITAGEAPSNGATMAEPNTHNALRFDTLATHNTEPEAPTGAIVPSICLATAFQQEEVGVAGGHTYTRFGNPNRNSLEANLAALEGAKTAICFSSGTAVTTALVNMVPRGGHIVSVSSVYGGTHKIFTQIINKTNEIGTTFVDLSHKDENVVAQRLEEAIGKGQTKLVWLETPTNPDLSLVDIALVSRVAKRIDPSIVVVVDSTFASPWFQNPLSLGADVVMHSLTKYLNGHSDVLMGAAVTSSDDLATHLRLHQAALGAVPSPFDCWLAMRGIKTLGVRMREHGRNALKLAKWMQAHPYIKDVIYPGLPEHPSFDLVAKQISPKAMQAQQPRNIAQDGIEYSGMLSFRLNCDATDKEPGAALLKRLEVITLALSLGGVESLIEQPSTMTHWMVPEAERLQLGIGHDLIRLSVGLEDVEDLMEDLDRALQAVFGGAAGKKMKMSA